MGPRDGVSSVTETGEKTVSQLLMQRAVETDTGIKTNKYFSFFKGSVEQISSDHLSTELRVHVQFTTIALNPFLIKTDGSIFLIFYRKFDDFHG